MICNRQAGDVFKREVSQQGMGTRYPIPLFAWNGGRNTFQGGDCDSESIAAQCVGYQSTKELAQVRVAEPDLHAQLRQRWPERPCPIRRLAVSSKV
jgi:hypothetical protein